MSENTPELPVSERRRSLLERLSIVWLVPLGALAVSLWIGWQTYAEQGPTIDIYFEEATGIRKGETELRYRDLTVGRVEEVGFSGSLDRVRVTVRLSRDIAEYADGDAAFWIVQPEVTSRGVSGLDTVLSGVFIEASWDTTPGGLVTEHQGIARAPLLRSGQSGLIIRLTAAPDAEIVGDTPILHKGVEVGLIGDPELTADGTVVRAEAAIFAPYDRLVSSNTRFWDTSGFSFSLGASGAELNFSSIATLIAGGVAFDTVVSGGQAVTDNAEFTIFADEGAARASLFRNDGGPILNLSAIFDDSFSGLGVGAPVLLDGVNVGEVVNLNGIVDEDAFGDTNVRLSTTMELRTSKMGLAEPTSESALAFLSERVANGLRAKLVSASILTGGLRIDLVDVPDVPPAALDPDGDPFPIIPVAAAEIADVSATAEGVMERINNLPIEELLEAATGFLTSARTLADNEDLKAIPGDVRGLVSDARTLTASEDLKALPSQVTALMTDLQGLSADLRTIVDSLEAAQAIDRIVAAIDAATEAATGVDESVAGIPDLVARLTEVAAKAEDLELQSLVNEVSQTVTAARSLLDNEGTQGLPDRLGAALGELEAVLEELREGGAVTSLNATLASASSASKAIEEAAADLPEFIARLERLAGEASTTLSGYSADSEINRTARATLNDIQDAARAIEQLARTLERRPNSIILGR